MTNYYQGKIDHFKKLWDLALENNKEAAAASHKPEYDTYVELLALQQQKVGT